MGDAQESLFYMKYKKAENQLYIYADDSTSRHISCTLQLDYDTVCGADKFGNIFIARLPSEISAQVGCLLQITQPSPKLAWELQHLACLDDGATPCFYMTTAGSMLTLCLTDCAATGGPLAHFEDDAFCPPCCFLQPGSNLQMEAEIRVAG